MHRITMKMLSTLLAKFGYEVCKSTCTGELRWRTNPGWDAQYIQKLGNPNTVIDVGVADGTPDLYAAFPEAYHILIDPLPMHEAAMKSYLATYNGEYHICGLGPLESKQTINVEVNSPGRSSFYKRTTASASNSNIEEVEVQVRTLDGLMAQGDYQKPYLLKIDTEGFELEVIRGAKMTLIDTQYVIAEVSVVKRFNHSYHFAEFIEEMHARGFRLYDILRVVRKPAINEVMILDAVFLNLNFERLEKSDV